ncbi:hypothetical protein F7725_013311 [Dissostichus mawsoni]|uniref:Peptidyl-prolyl cis-trans isomerase n=1 Tax=Dissostichus mawsoni TaxID=36200 RepID=A0A7J5YS61_DISMA|nr:hypothetical protein F7725_013311 [Dissostichus mawsoni]
MFPGQPSSCDSLRFHHLPLPPTPSSRALYPRFKMELRTMVPALLFLSAACLHSVSGAASRTGPKVTEKWCFFDITVGGHEVGRIVIGLFGEVVPLTVNNFVAALATGESGVCCAVMFLLSVNVCWSLCLSCLSLQKGYGYKETNIYGTTFADENFKLKHLGTGWVSMANAGPDTNGSQFFILATKAPWLDGKHVVFGKVLDGMSVVHTIELQDTNDRNLPYTECGRQQRQDPRQRALRGGGGGLVDNTVRTECDYYKLVINHMSRLLN